MNGGARGFTLIEMAVAIAIFAVIAAISYAALDGFLDARARIAMENERMRALQQAFVLMEQDLRYAVDRSVRDGFGDVEPAFVATTGGARGDAERLRLTTVRPVPGDNDAHQVMRVAWRLEEGALSRVTWQVLDRYLDSRTYPRRLLDDVEAMELTFFRFDENGQLDTDDEWSRKAGLPVGVEVVIRRAGQPAIHRTFQLAARQ